LEVDSLCISPTKKNNAEISPPQDLLTKNAYRTILIKTAKQTDRRNSEDVVQTAHLGWWYVKQALLQRAGCRGHGG
jgi:hypothetical protein